MSQRSPEFVERQLEVLHRRDAGLDFLYPELRVVPQSVPQFVRKQRGRLELDLPLDETFANLQGLIAERLGVEPFDGYARVEYEYLFFRHLITSSAPTHLLPSPSPASLSISATAPSILTESRFGRSFLSSSSTDLSTAARSSSLQFMWRSRLILSLSFLVMRNVTISLTLLCNTLQINKYYATGGPQRPSLHLRYADNPDRQLRGKCGSEVLPVESNVLRQAEQYGRQIIVDYLALRQRVHHENLLHHIVTVHVRQPVHDHRPHVVPHIP